MIWIEIDRIELIISFWFVGYKMDRLILYPLFKSITLPNTFVSTHFPEDKKDRPWVNSWGHRGQKSRNSKLTRHRKPALGRRWPFPSWWGFRPSPARKEAALNPGRFARTGSGRWCMDSNSWLLESRRFKIQILNSLFGLKGYRKWGRFKTKTDYLL